MLTKLLWVQITFVLGLLYNRFDNYRRRLSRRNRSKHRSESEAEDIEPTSKKVKKNADKTQETDKGSE